MDATLPTRWTIPDEPAHARTLWCPCGASFSCAGTRGCASECPWIEACGPSRSGFARSRDSSGPSFRAQCPACGGTRAYGADGYPESF